MADKQQPEALRLADELEEPLHDFPEPTTLEAEAASELRRQHGELETLRTGYAAARLEIESLKAQLHAAKQINTAQFGLLTSSIPGSALRASHWQAPAPAPAPAQAVAVAVAVAQAAESVPAGAGYAELPDAKTLGEAVAAWIGVETRGAHNWVDTTVGRLGFAVRSVVGDMLRASHGQAQPVHVQNSPENEHVADDVSKSERESNMTAQPGQEGELLQLAKAYKEYIDALPADVVAALPAMPGVDGDWASEVLDRATRAAPAQKGSND